MNRTVAVAVGVVVFHAAMVWALHLGLMQRAVELVVPVEAVARIIEIEEPKVALNQVPRPLTPLPAAAPPKPAPKQVKSPPPTRPVALKEEPPLATAPAAALDPQPAPPVTASATPGDAPAAPAPFAPAPSAPPAPPAPARTVEITQGETQYIRAPRLVYPPLSRRTGEAGVVMVAVYYNAQGQPRRAEILKSSGFERLDRAARDAVMASQVTAFQRPGTNENTEFLLKAPINFVLE